MSSPHEMPPTCPVCQKGLLIRSLCCEGCESELRGRFSLPRLARLPRDLQDVVVVFLQCRGNIKDVERELGISYPTVSKKLDTINLLLAEMETESEPRARILRRVQAGEITAAEALRLLKEEKEE